MIRQRLYLICPEAAAAGLEAAADAALRPIWIRMVRGTYEDGGGLPVAVASLQATDAEAASLALVVALCPGVALLRGPDDDGPRPGDQLADLGDALPRVALQLRVTWARACDDLGLTPVVRTPPARKP